MKKLLLLPLLALLAVTGMSAQKKAADKSAKARYEVYGVAFYNLENLFDTINNTASTTLNSRPPVPASGTARNTGQKSITWPVP